MWRTEGWSQPNFLLSADVLKTTKAIFKIWNVRASVFLQKNLVVFSYLMPANMDQKSGWLTLTFYHGPITGRIFLEYIVQSYMTSDQNQNISIAYAGILYPCSLLLTLTTESYLTTGSGYIWLGFLGGSVGKEFEIVWSLGGEDTLEKGMDIHPVFLPGEFHGQRGLVGYSPWGHKESDTTE